MISFVGFLQRCGCVRVAPLVGVAALNGVSNDVAGAKSTVEAPQPVGNARAQLATKSAVMIVVCVEQNSSRLFQAVAKRCDTASHSKLEWPLRGAAPQVCVNTLSREMALSSSGTCRAENAFLARATAKRPFLGCADRDTGVLRWPRTGVCWWQNTSMVLMAAAETSTTTTSSSTTTTTSSTTTTSTTKTTVPSVVAPVLVSVSASDGVQITVAGMRPDTGVYSLQWVPYGQSFNTYQMARATSPSMNVPAGWFVCNRTYTFRVFVMQAGWQLADGHQTQNVTPHSTPFDVVMPACIALTPTTTPVAALTCATGGACVVGNTGPGGGIVFYVASNFTSTGSDCGTTCKYLEAAPIGWGNGITVASGETTGSLTVDPQLKWCSDTSTALGTTARAIGTGMANTTTADGTCTSGAIQIAADYANNGKIDWHLPSNHEMTQLWNQRVTVGGFSNDWYYSSSEFAGHAVYADGFTDRNFLMNKMYAIYVRPVRAF